METLLSVIWIDWYAYHVARLRALNEYRPYMGRVQGVELVGRAGVHGRMVFRTAERDGLPIHTLLPEQSWSEATGIQLVKAIWNTLEELKPQVVLVPGYYTAPALAAALWAKRRRRKSILMTETTRGDHRRRWWREAGKRLLIRTLFDAAIAGGTRHVSYLRELNVPEARIGRCYDVVDNEFFRVGAADCRRAGRPSDPGLPARYFLYTGRLAPEKNLETLVRAFAKARASGATSSLVLAGDGPLRRNLETMVQTFGLEHAVVFAGHKSVCELLPYYAWAHAFVLPSRTEPWGLVVNEAMASGLPVIVSRNCGCADDLVEHNGNGFLIDPNCEDDMAAALLNADQWSEAGRESMSRRSEQLVTRCSLQRWAEEVFRLVRSLSFDTFTS